MEELKKNFRAGAQTCRHFHQAELTEQCEEKRDLAGDGGQGRNDDNHQMCFHSPCSALAIALTAPSIM
jgi:hypothetical protein